MMKTPELGLKIGLSLLSGVAKDVNPTTIL